MKTVYLIPLTTPHKYKIIVKERDRRTQFGRDHRKHELTPSECDILSEICRKMFGSANAVNHKYIGFDILTIPSDKEQEFLTRLRERTVWGRR